MSEDNNERFFDLLTKKVTYGLDEAEESQLRRMGVSDLDEEILTFEMTAAAITMADPGNEQLPSHLSAKIAEDSEKWVRPARGSAVAREEVADASSGWWFGWLGWGAAAAACAALAFNIYFTRMQPGTDVAVGPTPVQTPRVLTPAEMRDEMMRSPVAMISANWAPGNMKELKDVSGDVVWSDEKQTGYMRLKGLPPNDRTKETYQLWIFDKTQDKATPIDGGTFDIPADGEVVIPIKAKLTAMEPGMFAITMEKPGGVVVSKREKVAALATVETKTS